MTAANVLDPKTRLAIALIRAGVESDEQVAAASGLFPHKNLDRIEWVKKLRNDLFETVDLHLVVFCLNHRGPITQVPCMTCRGTGQPPRLEVRGTSWELEERRIMEARKLKKKQRSKKPWTKSKRY